MKQQYIKIEQNRRPSTFQTLLVFFVLMAVGSFIQIIPLYSVMYKLFSPVLMEISEGILLGNITNEQATAAFLKIEEMLVNHPLGIAATLIGTAGIAGLFIFWTVSVQKRPVAFLGIRAKRAIPHYLLGIVIGFSLFAVSIGICLLSGAATLSKATEVSWRYIALFFFGFLIQGFEEELLLRGFLMNNLMLSMPRFQAVFLSSLFFALLHLGNTGVTFLALLNITLFGIFCALYFIRTNSIWGVAAIHSVWNFVQGNFWGCSVSGMGISNSILITTPTPGRDTTFGGTFGPEGGLAVTIVLVTAVFIMLWTALPAKKKPKIK